MSDLFNQYGSGENQNGQNAMVQKALNFQKENNITDPKGMVQNMLNNGQMTQAQFNQLSQMASLILGNKKGR